MTSESDAEEQQHRHRLQQDLAAAVVGVGHVHVLLVHLEACSPYASYTWRLRASTTALCAARSPGIWPIARVAVAVGVVAQRELLYALDLFEGGAGVLEAGVVVADVGQGRPMVAVALRGRRRDAPRSSRPCRHRSSASRAARAARSGCGLAPLRLGPGSLVKSAMRPHQRHTTEARRRARFSRRLGRYVRARRAIRRGELYARRPRAVDCHGLSWTHAQFCSALLQRSARRRRSASARRCFALLVSPHPILSSSPHRERPERPSWRCSRVSPSSAASRR